MIELLIYAALFFGGGGLYFYARIRATQRLMREWDSQWNDTAPGCQEKISCTCKINSAKAKHGD